MFYLYQSNQTETLLQQLLKQLATPHNNPFVADTILVQNPGLAHWLKMQLAQAFGIAANIEFPLPSRFLWQIQRQLLPELAQESVFAKDSLSWLIYALLPACEQQAAFSPVHNYLRDKSDLGRYQLAAQLADMYDQYLVYRPDWILDWENGGTAGISDDGQLWQAQLWRIICEHIRQQGQPLCHRAHSLQMFQRALQHSATQLDLPKRLFIFGFSAMPKDMLDTFVLLAAHTDIYCFTPNPSEHYWADIKSARAQAGLRARGHSTELMDVGNPLLAGYGRMGQEYQQILLEHNHLLDEQLFKAPGQGNLLQRLQQDIFDLHDGSDPRQINADNSLHIMSCHSPVREIEVLHDHLLNLLENDPQLSVQDIVIMIPDVAAYAPYIDAVFNSAAVFLPYSIADRPAAAEHPLLSAFQFLLALPRSRFSVSELFAFVETKAVAEQFKLSADDINRLKIWCQQAGIRWGLSNTQQAALGLPQVAANTWQEGFKRLLAGYANSQNAAVLGVQPVGSVEGLQSEALGKLMQICDALAHALHKMQNPRSAGEWLVVLQDLKNTFFKFDENDSGAEEAILRAMQSFAAGTERINLQQQLEFELVADYCRAELEQSSGSQHFMVGKVNFCTLLPMRSIPFKVVCILGLNDGDYPRQSQPLGFDLMQHQRRLGDRSRREEDRYLFMEALLSARQHLLLSYRGYDQKTNGAKTPSVVLAELMDYLQGAYYIKQPGDLLAHICTAHKLQPFNPVYFTPNSGYFSYDPRWLKANQAAQQNTATLNSSAFVVPAHISLEDLSAFFRNAPQAFLRQQLDIKLFNHEEQQEDDEPFALDGLQRYQLKDQLLVSDIAGDKNLLNTGHLPVAAVGEYALQQLQADIHELRSINRLLQRWPRAAKQAVNYHFGQGYELQGWFENLYDKGHIIISSGKSSKKRLMDAWLKHLCLNSQHSLHTYAHYEDASLHFAAMAAGDARAMLDKYLAVYVRGMQKPLPLLADLLWPLIDPREKDPVKTASNALAGNSFNNIPGAQDDLHLRRCFGELQDLPEALLEIAAELGHCNAEDEDRQLWLDLELLNAK